MKILDHIPDGWAVVRDAANIPDGFVLIRNKQSRFRGSYKSAIVPAGIAEKALEKHSNRLKALEPDRRVAGE